MSDSDDAKMIQILNRPRVKGDDAKIKKAIENYTDARAGDVAAATMGKRVPVPFDVWIPLLQAGPQNDVFAPGDVLALRKHGELLPRQAACVGIKGRPDRFVRVYLGIARPGSRALEVLKSKGPAAVFWSGDEDDEIDAVLLEDLAFVMPVVGYTNKDEPFHQVTEWPVVRRARCLIDALERHLDRVPLVAVSDGTSRPLSVHGGSGSVH